MVLRIVLGVVYLGMALGQVASWSRMPAILGAYRLVEETAAAWLVTVAEIATLDAAPPDTRACQRREGQRLAATAADLGCPGRGAPDGAARVGLNPESGWPIRSPADGRQVIGLLTVCGGLAAGTDSR